MTNKRAIKNKSCKNLFTMQNNLFFDNLEGQDPDQDLIEDGTGIQKMDKICNTKRTIRKTVKTQRRRTNRKETDF